MTTTVLAFIPSPSQGVWHLGFVPIRAYALCIIAGIVAALVLGDRRWVARGGERGVIYDVALWAVPFGLIGGRLYHVMTDWQKYFGADGAGFLAALRIWDGGLGIWGAVALGGVGAWIECRRRGIPLPAFGDAIAPGIILAQAIGRLGNYFNQELYGRETDLPWGLKIYQRLDPAGVLSPHSLDGVSTGQVYAIVHPTFLYELLWNLLVFGVLLWADRRFTLGHGRLFALYVAGYCVGRFWVELMRSDTATLIAGIRVNTFTSTFVFIGAVIYIMVAPKGRDEPERLRGKDVVDVGEDEESRSDHAGEELAAVAATSGVVATAKSAGGEGEGGHEFTGGADVGSEAAAESEDLVAQVETAPSEDIAEATAFAAAGEAADEDGEAGSSWVDDSTTDAPEAGLGSVEGGEVEAAGAEASEVHEAAVSGAASAEAVADEVATDSSTEGSTDDSAAVPEGGLGSVDGGEVEAAGAEASEVHEAAVSGAASAEAAADDVASDDTSADSAAAPEAGLGSVEGGEVEAAGAEASEVHEAAVSRAASAEAVAVEVATDSSTESATHDSTADEVASEEPSADSAVEEDDSTAAPEAGLGSVEGGEVEAAGAEASEVHKAAVSGAASAEAAADEVATDSSTEGSTDDSAAAPEAVLGSVDGGEVEAAGAEASEVHEAAVSGAASAEATADEVATDSSTESATDDSTADEVASEEPSADSAVEEDDSTAAPEGGLGSVEGGEVEAAGAEASQVHEAAVSGAASADATADDVATDSSTESATDDSTADEVASEEPSADSAVEEDDSTAAPEAGLGSVEGGEVEAAGAEASQVHEAAVSGAASAEATADDVASDDATADDVAADDATADDVATEDATAQDAAADPTEETPTKATTEIPRSAYRAPAAPNPRRRWWRRT